VPAEISGERSENVTAFFRVFQNEQALVIAPKWLAGSGMGQNSGAQREFWENTSIVLPENVAESWRNVLTGESLTARGDRSEGLSLSDVLKDFPVGLFLSNPNS
jgi:maltooligosyltrehalose synthase